jgi:hypothetical protein
MSDFDEQSGEHLLALSSSEFDPIRNTKVLRTPDLRRFPDLKGRFGGTCVHGAGKQQAVESRNKYYLDKSLRDMVRSAALHTTPGARVSSKVFSTNWLKSSRTASAALVRGKLPDEIIEQVR